MRKLFTVALLSVLAVGGITLPTSLQAQETPQQRMKERVPKIDALKTQGVVGENNQGFLEPRGNLDSAGQALVKAENDDRRTAYQTIADRANTTADAVGRARAAQIAANSVSGVWLQSSSGSWYKK